MLRDHVHRTSAPRGVSVYIPPFTSTQVLLGDRGTWVWAACPKLLPDNATAGNRTHNHWVVSPTPLTITLPSHCIITYNWFSQTHFQFTIHFISRVLQSLWLPAIWLRHHPLRGEDSVRLQILSVGTCRQCGSWSVACLLYTSDAADE